MQEMKADRSRAGADRMATNTDRLTERQREALWKWRWLGWRDSTPGFKAALVLLVLIALAMLVAVLR